MKNYAKAAKDCERPERTGMDSGPRLSTETLKRDSCHARNRYPTPRTVSM
jgi:hypothetical protein